MDEIKKIEGVVLFENINLEKYTTIKLANTGSVVICKSIESLKELIHKLPSLNLKYHLVGWGANQVLLNTKNTLFIKLDFEFDKSLFHSPKDSYYLPASVPLTMLSSHATKFGLKGWEVFTGIPASFGGAIFMNAGTALGEISELIESVDILHINGEISTYIVDKEKSFSYRNNNFVKPGEVILGGVITHRGVDPKISDQIKEYLTYRKTTQPLTTKNCGSVFKNYSNEFRAGTTIDRIGLKEFGFDNLKVSRKHANFVENSGNAKAKDFKTLVECLKIDMERYTGHKFELEVKVY
jgi:UDP-N-acetylmuramate dehydrogenase